MCGLRPAERHIGDTLETRLEWINGIKVSRGMIYGAGIRTVPYELAVLIDLLTHYIT